MGRVHEDKVVKTLDGSLFVSSGYPLDVKTVVQSVSDLTKGALLKNSYEGLVVYVVDDKSLYVCYNKPKNNKLNSVEEGWERVSYSTRIVESESNLTDGTTIMFPYQGMMVYVTSESSLYVLLTKGVENAKDINNWRKISSTSSTAPAIDKVGIGVAPEGGSGFKITGNNGIIVDDYVNVENYIKASYAYTSKGVNSFEPNPYFTYDSIRLSKGGDSYIELYANSDNWMVINDPDNSLGLYELSGKSFAKGTTVCFGVDIQFTDGWTITYGNTTREFVESDYELIDIYRSEYSPEVYAYLKDVDVRLLTEDDLNTILHSIIVDLGEFDSDSDTEESPTLQEVIVQMNNSINKLEQTVVEVEPDPIDHSDIDQLF